MKKLIKVSLIIVTLMVFLMLSVSCDVTKGAGVTTNQEVINSAFILTAVGMFTLILYITYKRFKGIEFEHQHEEE